MGMMCGGDVVLCASEFKEFMTDTIHKLSSLITHCDLRTAIPAKTAMKLSIFIFIQAIYMYLLTNHSIQKQSYTLSTFVLKRLLAQDEEVLILC